MTRLLPAPETLLAALSASGWALTAVPVAHAAARRVGSCKDSGAGSLHAAAGPGLPRVVDGRAAIGAFEG
ncbi:MAG TPA: hypothetical protein VM576_02475 [Xanthomonadaceae bacterium]|nr:hypothetical protein [Xanthomonadaceae bacterium]